MSAFLPRGTALLDGEYEVVAHLGSGTFADVYHVVCPSLGEGAHFALKLIRPDAARGVGSALVADYERRFERESELATAIQNPLKAWPGREHVIQVYRVGRDEATGAQCAVLELAPGGSLADRLDARGPSSVPDAIPLFLAMLRGLLAVHAVGAIHRDIKPANILFAAGEVAKIADLGLAQVLTDDRRADSGWGSITGSEGSNHPGTPQYMSPEHGLPQALLPTSDIYSLGAVFFEVLTGMPWYRGRLHWSGPREAISALKESGNWLNPANGRPLAADGSVEDVPEWLDAVVQRMLRPTPGHYSPQRTDESVRWVLVLDVIEAVEQGMAADKGRLETQRVARAEPVVGQAPAHRLAEDSDESVRRAVDPDAEFGSDHRQILLAMLCDRGRDLEDRARAGRELAAWGDPRRGVGVRSDGAPDIEWVVVDGPGDSHGRLAVGRYTITWSQYESFLSAADGYVDDRWWRDGATEEHRRDGPGKQRWRIANHPAEHVSWYDAMAFCRWLSVRLDTVVRLPTLAEWRLVAGAAQGVAFPWGQRYEAGMANIDETCRGFEVGRNRFWRTTPVGMYDQGHPHGIFDLAGNVWEWTVSPLDAETAKVARAVCGGSWQCPNVDAKSSARWSAAMEGRVSDIGFRVFSDEAS